MSVAVTSRVVARNSMGRFIAACEQAATETVLDIAQQGANASRTFAPSRTGKLRASIQPFLLSRTQAVWGSSLKYALPQETGSVAHDMPANVSFFWEREGRMWMTPSQYLWITGFEGADPIRHPGNPATHFLRDGWRSVKPRMVAIADKHYPG